MLKAIEKIRPLEIKTICTGHGPILRSTWKEKVDISEKYAHEYLAQINHKNKCILIAYISAYGYTGEMAKKILEGIKTSCNYEVELADIENILLGDLEAKIVRSDAILIGSPTINQNTLLPIYKMFALINPIRDRGKLAAAFGSYGWSGEAVGIIETQLKNLKLKIFREGLSAKFYPYESKAGEFFDFGRNFAEELSRTKVIDE
jgi:flavorubredoxin